jgi:hypothetical protein
MLCGLFSCVFVCQGMPNSVCTTHIVANQQGCRGGEAGSFLQRTVVSFLPYSPNVVEGEFSEVRLLRVNVL